jgi:hypothetical protein
MVVPVYVFVLFQVILPTGRCLISMGKKKNFEGILRDTLRFPA